MERSALSTEKFEDALYFLHCAELTVHNKENVNKHSFPFRQIRLASVCFIYCMSSACACFSRASNLHTRNHVLRLIGHYQLQATIAINTAAKPKAERPEANATDNVSELRLPKFLLISRRMTAQ